MFQQGRGHQRLPRSGVFGKGVGLAGQRIQPVPQHTVQPLLVHRMRNLRWLSPHHADLHTHHAALTSLLDHLGQPHPRRGDPGRISTLPCPLGAPWVQWTSRRYTARPPLTQMTPARPWVRWRVDRTTFGAASSSDLPEDQATTKRGGVEVSLAEALLRRLPASLVPHGRAIR